MKKYMKILLDAMGGDNAPDANIKGAINAINQIKAEIVLIGKEDVIKSKIKELYGKTIEQISMIFYRNLATIPFLSSSDDFVAISTKSSKTFPPQK